MLAVYQGERFLFHGTKEDVTEHLGINEEEIKDCMKRKYKTKNKGKDVIKIYRVKKG